MDAATDTLIQFSFFIVFALLGTVLSIKLRQPYVVGLLILGMLAGPNVMSFISDKGLISTFSELGAILLLFTVGIEFSISKIFKAGFRALVITLFKMGTLFFFGYELALYFGLDLTTALYVGAMIAITSTAILYKVVSQKGLAKNPTMPLLFSMLIVEDIFAVVALTFFSALTAETLAAGGAAPTYENKFLSILLSLGFLGVFYILVRKPAARFILRLTETLSEEVMIFVSFSICLAMSMVAAAAGLTPAIGAFLAGSIVASLPNSRRIEKTIKPLLLMFASLFFLSLGMQIDPGAVIANLPFALVLTGVFVLVCSSAVLVLLYTTGATLENAAFGATAMVVMGEFSLLIASEATGQYAPLLLSAGSFGVVATAVISSFMIDRREKLASIVQRSVPPKAMNAIGQFAQYFTGVIHDFSPSGAFWRVSRMCWGCVRHKLGRIALIAIATFIVQLSFSAFHLLSGMQLTQVRWAVIVVAILSILYYIVGIVRDLVPMFDALRKIIARHKRDSTDESIIMRNLAISAVLMLIAINVHEWVALLQLPLLFDWLDDILFVVVLIFIWDLMRHAGKLHRKRGKERVSKWKARHKERAEKIRKLLRGQL
ncbi:Glutathione-regulated potassium-efflux system protein KefB [uncultured archaeon]|nr:Glutathione-regulated potassium-efflux system protein KefB [uncultured archaeon]